MDIKSRVVDVIPTRHFAFPVSIKFGSSLIRCVTFVICPFNEMVTNVSPNVNHRWLNGREMGRWGDREIGRHGMEFTLEMKWPLISNGVTPMELTDCLT